MKKPAHMIKYVVFDGFKVVSFNAPMQHKDMQALGEITSGGYFLMPGDPLGEPDGVTLCGDPLSIPVMQRPGDEELLNKFFTGKLG